MMFKKILLIGIGSIAVQNAAFAQQKPVLAPGAPVQTQGVKLHRPNFTKNESLEQTTPATYRALPFMISDKGSFTVVTEHDGLPTALRGTLKDANPNLLTQAIDYLEAIKVQLRCDAPTREFVLATQTTDDLQQTHLHYTQVYQGVNIYASDLLLHAKDGKIFMLNGKFLPTPNTLNMTASLDATQALAAGVKTLTGKTELAPLTPDQLKLVGGTQSKAEKVIYNASLWDENAKNETHLAWQLEVSVSPLERYDVFIDAQTGEILRSSSKVCHVDGPRTATATDLKGAAVNINTYQVGNTYYMMDGSRTMFNAAQSTLPNDPIGGIMTIDAQNTSSNNLAFVQITSSSNSWNNPKAVSAHNNGALAYLYYKNTFNRNSINGAGGTIVSLINVADDGGVGMDNAYWNGEAMFYGNGSTYFTPLAKSLDVAGHEMTHGVVQATANLVYQSQSGAMNESFADIFGAMIDRSNWKIGEDVVRAQYFPSGALRDLSNPHNGAATNGNGWQPSHFNERYTGTQDNGGVHINSGITNYAFYLFANNGSIGKAKAEQVFYRALSVYLVRSSQFQDLRTSVLQSVSDLYGANAPEIAIAASAFDQVGITGPSTPPAGGGGTAGGNYQNDMQVNPGADWIVYKSTNNNRLYAAMPTNIAGAVQISSREAISKPSVTDDGTYIVYTGVDNRIYGIDINWTTGAVTENALDAATTWRNIVVSKDGNRVAALTTQNDNTIYVFDFATSLDKTFTLYNPTTGTGGATTGGVQYADAMDFDYTGENLIYDAYNIIQNSSGSSIDYWDIGVLNAWTAASSSFPTGNIQKLFNGLPANTSVGNPIFSKNSPYIISFDFIDSRSSPTTYKVLGANLQTGNAGLIFANDVVGYPCYSRLDNKVLFNATDNNSNPILGLSDVATDKITGTGTPSIFISAANWGVWFANGSRSFAVATDNKTAKNSDLQVFPNPSRGDLLVRFRTTNADRKAILSLLDLTGRVLRTQQVSVTEGNNLLSFDATNVPQGSYFLTVQTDAQALVQKVIISD